MTIAKILERHQASLNEARKMLERPRVGSDDLKLSDSLRERRAAEIRARIQTLEAERKAVVERIDTAIAAEKEALESLDSQPTNPPKPGGGGSVKRPRQPIDNPVLVNQPRRPKQPKQPKRSKRPKRPTG